MVYKVCTINCVMSLVDQLMTIREHTYRNYIMNAIFNHALVHTNMLLYIHLQNVLDGSMAEI